MALEFRLPGDSLQHMTMLNTPMFGAARPEAFLAQMIAQRPDPATGKPDPAKLRAFRDSHPDNAPQAEFLAKNNPPLSYANSAYFGIHTFKLIDRDNRTRLVRWRFVPQDGEQRLSDAALKAAPANFLEPALIERTRRARCAGTWCSLSANPATRGQPDAGLARGPQGGQGGNAHDNFAMPQAGAACEKINFDPLVMAMASSQQKTRSCCSVRRPMRSRSRNGWAGSEHGRSRPEQSGKSANARTCTKASPSGAIAARARPNPIGLPWPGNWDRSCDYEEEGGSTQDKRPRGSAQ